jgi:hypothetical protein
MRRDALVIAMVIFSALFTYGFVGAKGDKDPVRVDVQKPTPTTTDNQPYDPDKPPQGATGKEDGYTHWEVKAGFGAASNPSVQKGSGTQTITLTLMRVDVQPALEITIYLPPAPPADASQSDKDRYATLQAHENGHKDLAQKVFDLVQKDTFEKHLSKVQKVYSRTVAEPVDQAAVLKALREELTTNVKAAGAAATTEIKQQIQTANDAYDAATQSGTKGPGGGAPDPKNQDQAAKQAAQDFQKGYKK